MFKARLLLLALALLAADARAQSGNTTGNLPYAGLMLQSDTAVINRGGITMRAQPYIWPTAGSVMVSTGTSAPLGIAPINNDCLVGVSGVWKASPCLPNGTLQATGTPAFGNLAVWQNATTIGNGDLSGDVTTAGDTATTLEAIQGTAIDGTTGDSGNPVVLSSNPNITGTITGQANTDFGSTHGYNFVPTSVADGTSPSIYSAGSDAIAIANANHPIVNFFGSASAVNYFQMESATTGSPLNLFASGTDANIPINWSTQGTGAHNFFADGPQQFQIAATASAVDFLSVTGAATGNPGVTPLTATGSDTNITVKIKAKGAGTVQAAGHLESAAGDTSAPTCGTGCSSITAGSTDVRGSLTTGSSVSSIALNFGTTWGSAPVCVVSGQSGSAVLTVGTPSTSLLTIAASAAVTSIKIYWICIQ